MRELWTSLNAPQAFVAGVALVAFFAGAVPPIVECLTHIIETVICLIAGPRTRFLHQPLPDVDPVFQERFFGKAASKPNDKASELKSHPHTCKGCLHYELGTGPCDACFEHDGWKPKEAVK
jgi:hypothetical protein